VRYYEEIWIRLKSLPLSEAKAKGVSIQADRRMHKRYIKAVRKEKWKDVPYKIKMDYRKTEMIAVSKGDILTFHLIVVPNLASITIHSL
jgi:hypothetical protein